MRKADGAQGRFGELIIKISGKPMRPRMEER
jgi:hypothetical protein